MFVCSHTIVIFDYGYFACFQMRFYGSDYDINSDDDVNVKYTYDSKKKKKKWLLVIEVVPCSNLLSRPFSLSLYGTPFPFLQR